MSPLLSSNPVARLALAFVLTLAPSGCGEDTPAQSTGDTATTAERDASRTLDTGNPDTGPSDSGQDTQISDLTAGDLLDTDATPEDAPLDIEAGCAPNAVRCESTTSAFVCDDDGEETRILCDDGYVCVDPNGCVEQICTPSEGLRCVDGDTTVVCSLLGTAEEERECTGGRSCDDGDPGACVATECSVGEGQCLEDGTPQVCGEEGLWETQADCVWDALGTECFEGRCRTQCEIARATRSYIGCDYWGADLGNFFVDREERNLDLAFVVTNADETLTAEVSLAIATLTLDTQEIGPGETAEFLVTGPRLLNNTGTGIRRNAYRLQSTVPVAAYQFNPIETYEGTNAAASTDASMLIPDQVLDQQFIVVAWEQTPAPGGIFTGGSLLAIIAGQTTTITMKPTADSASSLTFDGVEAMEPARFQLEAFEVLQLTTSRAGADWTGTTIEASAPVMVFSGNECARVPVGTNYCDHLEEGLFGLTSWGTTYVVACSEQRGDESDMFRVVAETDNTEVHVGGSLDTTFYLGARESQDFESDGEFIITANAPILVAQFLEGSSQVDAGCQPGYCSEVGDPSMMLVPPVGQYRDRYVFLTPDTYQQDWANIVVGAVDQTITLDGVELTDTPTLIDGGPYAVYRVDLHAIGDGPHSVFSDEPFGLMVYGYGGDDPLTSGAANVSYGFPGGLNFLPLNPKEPPLFE